MATWSDFPAPTPANTKANIQTVVCKSMLQVDAVAREGLLAPITLTVSAGDRLVVSGPSGSGKTLLLRSIAELDPHSGSLLLDDRPSRTYGIPAWRAQVMYIPQRLAFPPGNVREALQCSFKLTAHQTQTYSEQQALDLLQILGRTSELLNRKTNHLSGGEAQSVALVRALLLSPRIILADEITSALDPELAHLVERFLIGWTAQPNHALIWVGHNSEENQHIATSTLTLGTR
ncbi:putative ABC transporter ATP-binding protein YbbL [Corynebacterium freiburgense]|nr:putative ABC transporter ATP-binding protein YbbL [Corynebacterium freiburgense]